MNRDFYTIDHRNNDLTILKIIQRVAVVLFELCKQKKKVLNH